MKKDEVQKTHFLQIDPKMLDQVVRIIKYGMHYSTVISDDVKAFLEKWVREMEAEIHASEHHSQPNLFKDLNLQPLQPNDGEPV